MSHNRFANLATLNIEKTISINDEFILNKFAKIEKKIKL